MKPNRLEAFSDGVIAIIITIMVLELKAPHDGNMEALSKLVPALLYYLLSFVFVAIYWVNHHHLVHLVKKVDGATLWANMNLLFWLSLIPVTTSYLGECHASPMAVSLYGVIATACGLSYLLLLRAISRHHREDARLMQLHNNMVRKNLKALAIYLLSIPSAWISVPLSLALIATPAVMYFLPDRRVENCPADPAA